MYRARIGLFNNCSPKKKRHPFSPYTRRCFSSLDARMQSFGFVFELFLYILLIFMSSSLIIFIYCKRHIFLNGDDGMQIVAPPTSGCTFWGLSFLSTVHIKIAYVLLIMRIILRFFNGFHSRSFKRYYVGKRPSKCKATVLQLLLIIAIINFLMIAIINPSLLNPGPDNLKVCYQNVRGLIPWSNFKQTQPNLDQAKIYELNTYLTTERPDILLLSETWLKKSIKDAEIISNSLNYNVYRSDRSQLTHPSDPNNPTKYRKYGGGVLIAVRSDIDATVKRISVRRGAEVVAVELSINEVKYVFCVVYRVGTLGSENHKSITETIKPFFTGRKVKKIFILGDFNLSNVTWPLNETMETNWSPIENDFINLFNNFGLHQCISNSTHIKGRTLDLLLTNCPTIVDATVDKNSLICNSDHFPIRFNVKVNIRHKRPPKRNIFNFKRANWDALSRDLGGVNWDALIGSTEPEIAWQILKSKIFVYAKNHIPTMTVDNNFQPPWFDSDVHHANLKKKRAHAKRNKSELNALKFSQARKNF